VNRAVIGGVNNELEAKLAVERWLAKHYPGHHRVRSHEDDESACAGEALVIADPSGTERIVYLHVTSETDER
jgi:hypothetical protein